MYCDVFYNHDSAYSRVLIPPSAGLAPGPSIPTVRTSPLPRCPPPPSRIWTMTALRYAAVTGDTEWLSSFLPTLRTASSFVFDLINYFFYSHFGFNQRFHSNKTRLPRFPFFRHSTRFANPRALFLRSRWIFRRLNWRSSYQCFFGHYAFHACL